jgi:vancomycin resistance protein YoaR
MSSGETNTRQARGTVILGVAGALLLVSGGLVAAHFIFGERGEAAVPPPPPPADAAPGAPVVDVDALLGNTVTLRLGDRSTQVTWRALGFVEDETLSARGVAPITAADEVLSETLQGLRPLIERGPKNARLDFEQRKIHPPQDGLMMDVPAALGAVEAAARLGASEVEIPAVRVPAAITVKELGIDDISHVLATFTTKYAIVEKSRNFNLKHASSKLHGYVLQPGVEFSFNDVVGARTEREGYKIAHVILAGEMVDGQAGGTCQVSTTLHGASFFAGLDIIKGRPHSRPSTYVQMGLDATVVYPATDVKLRNPYEFPVVISYKVARGEATVEILGKKRPYDKIAFEREVYEEIEFETVTREDFEMPMGYMVVDQLGYPGYKVRRYRKFYKDGKVVKTDKWKLEYRPVTEYVRTGANPDPNLPPPKKTKLPHGPKPPRGKHYRMVQ